MLDLFLIASTLIPCACAKLNIGIRPTPSGQFDVLVDGAVWFPGSTHPVALHNHAFTQQTAMKKTSYVDHDLFTSTYTASSNTTMITTARVYDQHIIFSQSFPNGAKNTATGDRDSVLSTFPSFLVENSTVTGRRGYLQFQGDMVGASYTTGEWNDHTTGIASGIKGTGPLCIFQQSSHLAVVLSPFTNAMAANQKYTIEGSTNTLDYGIMGNVTNIPPGYELSTIVSFAEGSVNNAMMTWGDLLLSNYQKDRKAAWVKDFALQFLGYSTDNGAYYYYTTEKNKNYQETMLDIAQDAATQKIPYRYWLADSWWYYKGVKDGVKNWTSMKSVFPDGLKYIYDETGWLVQGHNRFWSMNTDYAKQNGGNWNFILDPDSQYALPYDQEFWNYLMQTSRKWGCVVSFFLFFFKLEFFLLCPSDLLIIELFTDFLCIVILFLHSFFQQINDVRTRLVGR